MQMKQKSHVRRKLITLCFCICVIASFLTICSVSNIPAASDEAKPEDDKVIESPEKQLIVTYFHTNYRCSTCKKIEKYSKEVVENNFQKELKEKKVVYRTLNMVEPENKHYIDDYKLVTKSIILSIIDNGKETKWKNLPDIWKTIRKKEKFDEYVLKEIREYMKEMANAGK